MNYKIVIGLLLFLFSNALFAYRLSYEIIPKIPTKDIETEVKINEWYGSFSPGISSCNTYQIKDTIIIDVESEVCSGGCFFALDYDSCSLDLKFLNPGKYYLKINQHQKSGYIINDTTYMDSFIVRHKLAPEFVGTWDWVYNTWLHENDYRSPLIEEYECKLNITIDSYFVYISDTLEYKDVIIDSMDGSGYALQLNQIDMYHGITLLPLYWELDKRGEDSLFFKSMGANLYDRLYLKGEPLSITSEQKPFLNLDNTNVIINGFNNIIINFNNREQIEITWSIHDFLGLELNQGVIHNGSTLISKKGLQPGIYLLLLNSGNQIKAIKKFLVNLE